MSQETAQLLETGSEHIKHPTSAIVEQLERLSSDWQTIDFVNLNELQATAIRRLCEIL